MNKLLLTDTSKIKSAVHQLAEPSANIVFAITLIAMMISTQALATDKAHRGNAPKAAIDACANQYEGDLVSFEARNGDVLEAVCKVMDDTLVAAPLNRPAKHERSSKRPPPEAVEACDGKAEQDLVSFETRNADVKEGICTLMNDTLVAMPNKREGAYYE
jgi:hypothetical protein